VWRSTQLLFPSWRCPQDHGQRLPTPRDCGSSSALAQPPQVPPGPRLDRGRQRLLSGAFVYANATGARNTQRRTQTTVPGGEVFKFRASTARPLARRARLRLSHCLLRRRARCSPARDASEQSRSDPTRPHHRPARDASLANPAQRRPRSAHGATRRIGALEAIDPSRAAGRRSVAGTRRSRVTAPSPSCRPSGFSTVRQSTNCAQLLG
jgi:hypothetical protein